MSAEATGWVWKHSPYEGAQLLVHLAIADVVNDIHENEFWMSTATLAAKAKVSRSTVTATLRDMSDRGLLVLLQAGGASRKPSRYRFTSALTDSTSAIWPSGLDRSPVTIPIEPNEKGTSALSGLADCAQCQGRGSYYHAGAGCDRACECTAKQRRLKAV
jgi:hypothetical protein